METYIAYIRVELNDEQLEKLLEKASQSMEEPPKATPPKVVIYEDEREHHILVYPEILKVTAAPKDRTDRLILEGEVCPYGNRFVISVLK